MGGKPRPKPPSGFRTLGLSDEYRQWVCASLKEGESAKSIYEALIAQGVHTDIALREIDIIESATRRLRQHGKRYELQLELQSVLEVEPLDELDKVSEDEFYRHYYGLNRPTLLRKQISHWPQCGQWSPAWFKENFGGIQIDVNDQRIENPERMIDPENHLRTMRLADFIDTVETEQGNNVYMVSRNRALEGPLSALLGGIRDMPDFLDSDLRGRASLWLGPAGTVTPLHHDTTNVFFCQMYGTKRIRLVSPRHLPTLRGELESTFYSRLAAIDGPHQYVVTLNVGEALFLPVGWWHEIEAMTPSISLSLTNFKRKNHYDWYRPGDY